jgi:hypothetical protein
VDGGLSQFVQGSVPGHAKLFSAARLPALRYPESAWVPEPRISFLMPASQLLHHKQEACKQDQGCLQDGQSVRQSVENTLSKTHGILTDTGEECRAFRKAGAGESV